METTQPAAPAADGMTQGQLDDVYARVLAAQGKASRVLGRAARLRASMTELLGSPAAGTRITR
jgi:hypothetical protein